MSDPGQARAASPTVVLCCSVDGCPWQLEPTRPEPGVGESMRSAIREARSLGEQATRAHLGTHPVEDFLRTIAGLRAQLAATTGALRPVSVRADRYAVVNGQRYQADRPPVLTPDPDGAIRAADGTVVAYLSQPGVSQQ